MANSILRMFSTWRASGAIMFRRLIFVTPSTSRATSGAEAFLNSGEGKLGVFDHVVQERGGQRRGIQAQVREDVCDLEQMRQVRFARPAELFAMPLGGYFVSAADHPGIFGGAIFAQLGQQFFEAGVELALGAIAVEVNGRLLGEGMPASFTSRPYYSAGCKRLPERGLARHALMR